MIRNSCLPLALALFISSFVKAQKTELVLPQGHDFFVINADIDSKGQNLLTVAKEGEAYLWDVRSSLPYYKLPGQRWDVMVAKFITDSTFVTGGEESKLLIYNINNPAVYRAVPLPERGVVMALDLDPTRKKLAFVAWFYDPDRGGSFRLYLLDIASMKFLQDEEIETYNLSASSSISLITSLKFSPDGKHLIATQGKNLFHWRLSPANKFEYSGDDENENNTRSVNYYSANEALLTDAAGSTRILNLETGAISQASIKPDGSRVSVEEYNPATGFFIQAIGDSFRLVNLKTGQELYRVASGHEMIIGIKSAPAQNLLFTYDIEGNVKSWYLSTGKPLSEYVSHSGDVRQLYFNEEKNLLVSGNQDNRIRFWNLNKLELENVIEAGRYETFDKHHRHGIIGMDFAEKTGLVAATSDNTSLRLVNYKDRVSLDSIEFSNVPNHVKLLPENDLLFVNEYTKFAVYRLSTRELLKEYDKHMYWNPNEGQFQVQDPESFFTGVRGENSIYISNAEGDLGILGLSLKNFDTTVFIPESHLGKITGITKIPGKDRLVTTSQDSTIKLWDIKDTANVTHHELKLKYRIETFQYDPKSEKIYAVTDGDELLVLSINNNGFSIVQKAYMPKGLSIAISSSRKQLFVGSGHNTVSIWNMDPLEKVGDIIYVDSSDYVIVDKFNNYKASKNSLNRVGVKQERKILSMMQFDAVLNRPDKVLNNTGNADQELVATYKRAYEKRMKKLGIDTTMFTSRIFIPETVIANAESLAIEQKSPQVKLQIRSADNNYPLERFNVWINEIPLFGLKGLSLKERNTRNFDTSMTVVLTPGKNIIETSVTNINGTESFRAPLTLSYATTLPSKEKLHFIGIGIDRFADGKHNLSYSVKDIRDLAVKLKQKYKETITIDTLFNEKVTVANVMALKSSLLKTTENDKVILSYSGHGLLSTSYDYYLSTFSVDFKNPENGGLAYDQLESLLDSIPARKKLLLIDACHSGEVDKEEMQHYKQVMGSSPNPGLKGGELELSDTSSKKLGMKNSFELMQELFVNVGRSTGATIISAAAGTQLAQERGDLKNGVFTYSILEFMKANPTATVTALKNYVNKRVPELTNGLQVPTTRTETKLIDWRIW